MRAYKSEAAFSRAFVKSLRDNKCFVQRIESRETGVGIPDLYVINAKGEERWVELKNMPQASINDKSWHIDWRKGQQAWAWQYHVATLTKCVYTIVAMSDGFIIIPQLTTYSFNSIEANKVVTVSSLNYLIKNTIF